MDIGSICQRAVLCCEEHTTSLEAAKFMRQGHVGDLVVMRKLPDGSRVPVGVITDRDLVLEVLAQGLDGEEVLVGDLMTQDLGTATENEGVYEVLARMWELGVRRMPVVNPQGRLVGIITTDDLIGHVAELLSALNRICAVQQEREYAERH